LKAIQLPSLAATDLHLADGLDDLVCIQTNGDMYLSINQGNGVGNTPPTFKTIGLVKPNEGYPQAQVIVGDIDGDGRGDYGIIDAGGNVWFWRNGGVTDAPEYWQALGMRFADQGMGDIAGLRFEDINGDGRDDAMWMSVAGTTYTWTNARSCVQGKGGDGLNVAWRQAFYSGETSGPTHAGVGNYITATETNLRNRVHFARIYGLPTDFTNLPRQDYVFFHHTVLASGLNQYEVRVAKNTGGGGTRMKADGNKYGNMVGHASGADDYVWAWSTGAMMMFPNGGKTHISEGESFWGTWAGVIWTPPTDKNRRDLHLVDWDGDGDCDIVWVDPDNNNKVSVWINNFPQTQDWATAWEFIGTPAKASALQCSERRGLGVHDCEWRPS
jgi:hypothetical protein